MNRFARRPTVVTHVCVVIPALNECDRISVSLDAVIAACRTDRTVSAAIAVVDDGSDDGTACVARRALRRFEGWWAVVAADASGAGDARRLGVEVARRAAIDPRRTWLLSTDADSVVPVDWVGRHLRHARSGAPAVAGVVNLIDDDEAVDIRERWAVEYGATVRPDASHPHVHAANLGIRLDVYDQVGGFAAVDRAEDIDLWRRVRSSGYLPVADASITVGTSARPRGRVERGFADALNRLYRQTA